MEVKNLILQFFEEQREFTDEEKKAYEDMLKRLSIETDVNILEFFD